MRPTGVDRFLAEACAIALVIDPAGARPDPSLFAMCSGGRIAPAAARGGRGLGISEETARTVLKRVFSKFGIARQSELAALMTKLVPR